MKRSHVARRWAESQPHGLTPAEFRVAQLVAGGETDKVIAAKLGLAHPSVSYQLRAIARAWNLTKNVRVQVALRMHAQGWAS